MYIFYYLLICSFYIFILEHIAIVYLYLFRYILGLYEGNIYKGKYNIFVLYNKI